MPEIFPCGSLLRSIQRGAKYFSNRSRLVNCAAGTWVAPFQATAPQIIVPLQDSGTAIGHSQKDDIITFWLHNKTSRPQAALTVLLLALVTQAVRPGQGQLAAGGAHTHPHTHWEPAHSNYIMLYSDIGLPTTIQEVSSRISLLKVNAEKRWERFNFRDLT